MNHQIKSLVPERQAIEASEERCSAVTQEWKAAPRLREWRERRYAGEHDPKCCQRHAVVLIDGQPYCRQHGGALALRILLEMQDGEAPLKTSA